jgi:metal-responsive CopG/Arc/MetJ family transcriptional regulator
MASSKPLLNFFIDQELLDKIGVFWHKHKFKTRSEAIRWLLKAALDAKLVPKGE